MKQRTKKIGVSGTTVPQSTFRMDPAMHTRLVRVAEVSRRTKTSVLEECLERVLPDLEKKYDVATAA